MAHEAILRLPTDAKQRLDVALTTGKSTGVAAKQLKSEGYFPELGVESLARTLRNYKRDCITIHEVARREALSRATNPIARKALREKVDAYQMHADWVKLLDHRRSVYEKAAQAVKNAPGIAALSDTLRRAARDLHDMYRDHTRFLMDAGLIQRAPQQVHIMAEHIVIGTTKDAAQVLEALTDYVTRAAVDEDERTHIEGALQQSLWYLRDRRLDPESQRVMARIRQIMDESPRLPTPEPPVEEAEYVVVTPFRADDPE